MTAIRTISIIFILAATLTACVTPPPSAPAPTAGTEPQWVTATPKATADHTFFVGTGSDAAGNLAAANEDAARSLVSKVRSYLGEPLGAAASKEAQAELKRFETKLAKSISEGARVSGFTVSRHYVRRQGGRVTVFLLGRYSTSVLNAERAKLIAAERERTDPAAVLEKRGDELLSRGRPYRAAVEFIRAATAAAGSTRGGSELERNVEKAKQAVTEIRLALHADNIEGRLDEKLPKPFLLAVTAGGDRNEPIAGARFQVTFPVPGGNGAVDERTMTLSSDANGSLSVELPPPRLLGPQTATVVLDLAAELEPLVLAASDHHALVSSLEEQIAAVRATLHYRTTSAAASIPTGVLVMDLDRGGTPIPGDDTALGIENALTRAGYHILPIPSNRSILGIDVPDLVKILRNNFGGKIQRAIVGQARISGFEHDDGTYIVKVTGQVNVADLATGKVLLETSLVKLSRASDASSAINAAFKDLGTSIGNEIKNRLR